MIANRPVRVAHVTTIDLTLQVLLIGQLRRLRDAGYEVTTISAPGPAVGSLVAEGIRHIPWPHVTRAWDLGSDVRAFRALLAILRRERFDLVHAHNPKPGVMARVGARMAGVPCIVNTVHGLYASPDDPLRRRIPVLAAERLAARFSDLELFQSEEDLRWAGRIRLAPQTRRVLLGNGTDVRHFDPDRVSAERRTDLRRRFGIPPDAPVVGTVGRLVAEKGVREVLDAARRVRRAVPEARFLLVGDRDPDKWDAIREEEIRGAGPGIVWVGWRDDVRDLLALMDVFVLASWREGVPRSAIEAAAMGRPLVLTDIRGCREVTGPDGGLLVPVRDPEALAAAVVRLLRDPAFREGLGKGARARALERFDERRVEKILLEQYAALLGRKGMLRAARPPIREPIP